MKVEIDATTDEIIAYLRTLAGFFDARGDVTDLCVEIGPGGLKVVRVTYDYSGTHVVDEFDIREFFEAMVTGPATYDPDCFWWEDVLRHLYRGDLKP